MLLNSYSKVCKKVGSEYKKKDFHRTGQNTLAQLFTSAEYYPVSSSTIDLTEEPLIEILGVGPNSEHGLRNLE
ncbi:hypothetical protein J6590_041438 [Homalodisca vitripennis]|nr:hypothetical protein J6590_041438 [Homalodisca vitripennis]